MGTDSDHNTSGADAVVPAARSAIESLEHSSEFNFGGAHPSLSDLRIGVFQHLTILGTLAQGAAPYATSGCQSFIDGLSLGKNDVAIMQRADGVLKLETGICTPQEALQTSEGRRVVRAPGVNGQRQRARVRRAAAAWRA